MKDQFFYRVNGRVLGPVKFAALVVLLRTQKISPGDTVRAQGSEKWMRADSVMTSLLPLQANAGANDRDGSQVPSQKALSGAARSGRTKGRPCFLIQFSASLFSYVGDAIEQLVLFVTNSTSTAFGKLERKHAVVAVVIVAFLSLNLGWYYYTRPPFEQEIAAYEMLGAIWGDLVELRESDASEEDWTAFQEQTSPKITGLVEELEDGATASNQVRMQLLWASRDFLPQMLTDAREGPSASEALFGRHMRQTTQLLAKAGESVR